MRSTLRQLFLIAFVTLTAVAAVDAEQAFVTRVVDGDTIVVEGIGTIRLIGVDTPETVDPRKPVQYFGAEASAFTMKLAQGKAVWLEFEGVTKDKYNRTLAYIYLPDDTLLNTEIIRQGYGHAYTEFPFSKMEEFRRLQREAAEAGRGLWGSPSGDAAALATFSAEPQRGQPTETIYVTRTGVKYHRAGCRHLARSQIPMSLKDAAARYGPCSVCRPPVLDSVPANSAVPPPDAAAAVESDNSSPSASTPVLITRTGQNYHREGSRTLRNGGFRARSERRRSGMGRAEFAGRRFSVRRVHRCGSAANPHRVAGLVDPLLVTPCEPASNRGAAAA